MTSILPGTTTVDVLLTQNGVVNPVQRFTAAGTVTSSSGIIDFNASVAGFAVQLPAPAPGADYTITQHTAPSSGTNTITLPAGGTIYQLASSGSILNFANAGQAVRLVGLSSTQYQVVFNLGTVTLA